MIKKAAHLYKQTLMICSLILSMLAAGGVQTTFAQDNEGVTYASVIMYHRFGEDRYPSTNTTIEQLESHIAYLQEGGFTIMALPEIIERFQSGRTVPDRTVAISIDDAYLSVYKEGWPRFRDAGFPITLFVATGPIDRNLRDYKLGSIARAASCWRFYWLSNQFSPAYASYFN